MKKTNSFTDLSDKVCNVKGCNTRLKRRLTEARFMRNIKTCYKHHVIAENARGHIMKGDKTRKSDFTIIGGVGFKC